MTDDDVSLESIQPLITHTVIAALFAFREKLIALFLFIYKITKYIVNKYVKIKLLLWMNHWIGNVNLLHVCEKPDGF